MKKNLIFIGFMGAGKTSVGEAYAKKFGWPIVDTDQLIEEEAGMTITRIFAEKGEAAFRETETSVMQRLLSDCDNTVISVGGGLPLRAENRIILKELGMVVFLRVQQETVLKRLAGDTTRPLLQTENVEERVRELLDYRNPIYAEASHIVIDTDDKTPDEIALKAGVEAGFLSR